MRVRDPRLDARVFGATADACPADVRTTVYVHAAAACLHTRATIVGVAVLLLNDHILKLAAPSWLTGKLSDFAGLYFAPYLALLAVFASMWVAQSVGWAGGAGRRTVPAALADAMAASVFVGMAGLFVALKLSPATSGEALALLQMATGYRHAVTVDPGDLLALAVMPLSYLAWRRQVERSTETVWPTLCGRLRRAGQAVVIGLAGLATVATSAPVTPGFVSLVADPATPGGLYALAIEQGGAAGPASRAVVYRTRDAGDSWGRFGAPVIGVAAGRVVPDAAAPGRLYLAAPGGVWRLDETTPPRQVWPPPDVPNAGGGLPSVVAPTWEPGVLYVGAGDVLARTGDGGETWTRLPSPTEADQPVTVLVAEPDPMSLHLLQERRLWWSGDGGHQWEARTPLDAAPCGLWSQPKLHGVLLSATATGLLASDDGGATAWSAVWDGGAVDRTGCSVTSVAFDPEDPMVVWAAAPGHGLIVSTDAGRSWRLSFGGDARGVEVAPRPDRGVLVAAGREGIFRQRGWLRWPWLGEWAHADTGLVGRLTSGRSDWPIELASSLMGVSVAVALAVLAARFIVPARLRTIVVGHPWELFLAGWTLFADAELLNFLLGRQATDAAPLQSHPVLLASILGVCGLMFLPKVRWSWLTWGLATAPIALMLLVLVSQIPNFSTAALLAVLAFGLALVARRLPSWAGKMALIACGMLVYLVPMLVVALIWLVG